MNDTYPRKFDASKLSDADTQLLADFHKRRQLFDAFIAANSLNIFTCPSCGYPTLTGRGHYDLCSICDWEDDNQDDQEADEIWGGPNANLSLTEGRLQIGKVLHELAKKVNGLVLLEPEEVLSLLDARKEEIAVFENNNITGQTRAGDPIWEEWKQLRKDTLKCLITTPS